MEREIKNPERTPPEEREARRLADSLVMHAVYINWPHGKAGAIQKLINNIGHEPFKALKSHHCSNQRMPEELKNTKKHE